ncbi:MAG: acyl-CoA thioesterase [Fimbriimonadaceae bacterium]|nr:acyl-CoA thioesterase [Chitinophagales bacterium]
MTELYFPIILKLRIDWSEMDLFGHINNVMYAKYIQASRVRYVEEIGIMKMLHEDKIGFMLASSSLQYKKPLHYPGEIIVQTRCEFVKNTSFGIHHQILNATNEIAAEAHDVLVMFDFNHNEKITIPDSVKKTISSLENTP